ncbi:TetR/AcrR family transcriptional regulator [Amycolatopsis sp. GM8]|uniref:TetR/AcrR family transcriptional regulator n=1 Tax=Amycolatopsis sp. GM8 TaxID=2896530 RepID=UPI001F3BF8C9|nr:TetR/AcrR family transcriptional regulator [Amycolatopsis sp. GM8]
MADFQRARSAEQRETRRRAILDTAAKMLEEMPVRAVSLNELSRRVGRAKSNVLSYFESREAILLELLNAEWTDWIEELPGLFDAGVDRDASPSDRAAQIATVVVRSLTGREVLCDLLSEQAAVLEQNVSAAVAARYKREALASVDALAVQLRRHLPELRDRAEAAAANATLVTGAIWTTARPSPGMLEAYADDPSLADFRVHFGPKLEDVLVTLLLGALARARRRR